MFPDSAGHGMLIATLIFIVQDLSSLGGAQAWTYNYSTSPNRRWPEASQWCRQHFTAMASMQNQEESNFLNDLLPFTSKYYWIGVRKEGEAWLRDGTDQKVPEDAQDWAPEEPDSIEGQDCVEVYIKRDKDTAKWNNENCRKKKGTVCYSISCRPDSCSEHADCVETVGGHSCQCHPGFQGPRCETAVSCEQSLDVERGSHYCSHPYGSNRFNSSCLFHCERGFLLAGASALLCQANGRWDRPVPLCQAVQCPVLDQRNISAGSLNCSHPIAPHSYNSTCEARCDAGYEPSGQEQIWCDHSGRWTASVLTCRVKKCSTVSFPVTGNMTCLDAIEPFAFGSRCNFTCKEGFNLRGETSLSCLATGEWSSPPPTCTGGSSRGRRTATLRDPLPAGPVLRLPPADPPRSDHSRRPRLLPEGTVEGGNGQDHHQSSGRLPWEQLHHGAGLGLHPEEYAVLRLDRPSGLERQHGDRQQLPAALPLLLPERLGHLGKLLRQRLLRGSDPGLARLRCGLCGQCGDLVPHQHRRGAGDLRGCGFHRAAGDDSVHLPVQARPYGGLHQSAQVLTLSQTSCRSTEAPPRGRVVYFFSNLCSDVK